MRHEVVRSAAAQARLDAIASFRFWRRLLADLGKRGIVPITLPTLRGA